MLSSNGGRDFASFNSRTREGCDTPPSPFVCASTAFQFTHLRGVRPFAPRLAARLVVSIHAPARGATLRTTTQKVMRGRFNSRTREGCDRPVFGRTQFGWGFNSRTREGCDEEVCGKPPSHSRRFNSRTREGCDENNFENKRI